MLLFIGITLIDSMSHGMGGTINVHFRCLGMSINVFMYSFCVFPNFSFRLLKITIRKPFIVVPLLSVIDLVIIGWVGLSCVTYTS